MVRWAALLCVALAVPAAAAQTYDTPSTLVVDLSHPVYMHVDSAGYATVTGMVKNDSEHSYVANVQIMARFYGTDSREPLDMAVSAAGLQVIPPESSSPFAVTSTRPDFRFSWAAASLLLFDPANPKAEGLRAGPVLHDGDTLTLNVTDSVGAPHTNIRLHTAYHDAFDPPRILSVATHRVGDLELGGTLEVSVRHETPYGARGFEVFAESDHFGGDARGGTLPPPAEPRNPAPPYITSAWLDNGTGRTDSVARGLEAGINAAVRPAEGDYRVYFQVTRAGDPGIVFLGGANVTSASDVVSVSYTPERAGPHVVETFLWGLPGMPAARPGPAVQFAVE